jgi:integrase
MPLWLGREIGWRCDARLKGCRVRALNNLRHTFASVALTHAKLPLLDVSKMLGHSSMVVTAKAYPHFVQERLDEIQRAISSVHRADASGASNWTTPENSLSKSA